jgi:branched-chain amino acid transport system ATP-binding protein
LSFFSADIPEAGYGKKVVLENVAFSIERGAIAAFIGPNGAGKSTLLKVLMGMLPTKDCSVQLDGTHLASHNAELNVKRGMSFVPQGNRVFTELSVRENLEVGGYLISDNKQVASRIEILTEIFPDLKDRLKSNSGVLSGGQKQQLALARALMLKPKVLMLDEPSLGLSPKLVTKAFDTIQQINRDLGTTILIVEQKVREVLRIATRVYALRMGEIVFSGSPAEVQQGETMKKIFLV